MTALAMTSAVIAATDARSAARERLDLPAPPGHVALDDARMGSSW
jgi:hypothetical protein